MADRSPGRRPPAEVPPIPRPDAADARPRRPADERGSALQRGADRGPGDHRPDCLQGGAEHREGMPGRVVSNVAGGPDRAASNPAPARCSAGAGKPIRTRVAGGPTAGTGTRGRSRRRSALQTRKAPLDMTTQPDAGPRRIEPRSSGSAWTADDRNGSPPATTASCSAARPRPTPRCSRRSSASNPSSSGSASRSPTSRRPSWPRSPGGSTAPSCTGSPSGSTTGLERRGRSFHESSAEELTELSCAELTARARATIRPLAPRPDDGSAASPSRSGRPVRRRSRPFAIPVRRSVAGRALDNIRRGPRRILKRDPPREVSRDVDRSSAARTPAKAVSSMDDRALVEALRAGDPLRPGRLVERFHGVVFGLCFRMMGHRHDAEDVVAGVLPPGPRAGSPGSTASGRSAPGCWGSPPTDAGPPSVAAADGPSRRSPRGRVDHRPGLTDPDDLAGELERALDRLRPEYRLVFALFHEQGLPYEEIGQAIGRPVGTVKTWLHRARAELADDLARRGVRC